MKGVSPVPITRNMVLVILSNLELSPQGVSMGCCDASQKTSTQSDHHNIAAYVWPTILSSD